MPQCHRFDYFIMDYSKVTDDGLFDVLCRLQALRLLQKLHKAAVFADVRGDKYDAETFIDSRSRLYRSANYAIISMNCCNIIIIYSGLCCFA